MHTRHKFYGPNGVEVNFDEFARLISTMGTKQPLIVRMKKAKKRKTFSVKRK